jgi:hypothetical protein
MHACMHASIECPPPPQLITCSGCSGWLVAGSCTHLLDLPLVHAVAQHGASGLHLNDGPQAKPRRGTHTACQPVIEAGQAFGRGWVYTWRGHARTMAGEPSRSTLTVADPASTSVRFATWMRAPDCSRSCLMFCPPWPDRRATHTHTRGRTDGRESEPDKAGRQLTHTKRP